jgi:hypothetical protein
VKNKKTSREILILKEHIYSPKQSSTHAKTNHHEHSNRVLLFGNTSIHLVEYLRLQRHLFYFFYFNLQEHCIRAITFPPLILLSPLVFQLNFKKDISIISSELHVCKGKYESYIRLQRIMSHLKTTKITDYRVHLYVNLGKKLGEHADNCGIVLTRDKGRFQNQCVNGGQGWMVTISSQVRHISFSPFHGYHYLLQLKGVLQLLAQKLEEFPLIQRMSCNVGKRDCYHIIQ